MKVNQRIVLVVPHGAKSLNLSKKSLFVSFDTFVKDQRYLDRGGVRAGRDSSESEAPLDSSRLKDIPASDIEAGLYFMTGGNAVAQGNISLRARRYGMAVVLAGMLAVTNAAVAKADIIYSLDFRSSNGSVSEGTGVLDLNLASLSAAYNLNQTLSSILVSITTTSINGRGGFTITPATMVTTSNTGQNWIQTGNVGQFYTLSAMGTSTAPTLALDLFTNTWQIHQGTNGATVDSGTLTITGPTLSASAVPGPIVGAGLPGLLAGFSVVLAWRRRRRAAA